MACLTLSKHKLRGVEGGGGGGGGSFDLYTCLRIWENVVPIAYAPISERSGTGGCLLMQNVRICKIQFLITSLYIHVYYDDIVLQVQTIVSFKGARYL